MTSHRYEVGRVAVIGAGNMGGGIAQKYAAEGFPVTLVDLDQARVDAGLARVRATLAEGVERRIFDAARAAAIDGRIEGTTDWARLSDADLVVEAVFEDLAVKADVFARLGRACRGDALLATNTSSYRVADVAAGPGVTGPHRILGLHYFHHPAKNRLVEVVGHAGTDPAALAAAWAAQEAVGKTPIRSADAPGFVVNRFFVPWLNAAVRLLAEGVADVPTIEAAARAAFGVAMGPFQLMNVTGVPIAFHAATSLGQALHGFYAPDDRLRDQTAAGRPWDLSGEPDPTRFGAVADRLMGVVFHVAATLVDEGVSTVEDADVGARVGLRWPEGPFALMNRAGRSRARELAAAATARFDLPAPAILAPVAGDGPVPIRVVTVEPLRAADGGEVGTALRIDRPDALNALNPAVAAQLGPALAAARARARAAGGPIVVVGAGKAFVAGADVKFFVERLRDGDFPAIRGFTEGLAAVLSGLSGGDGAVVARVHGLSLGGGSELALACDRIVCGERASFGFPETGIGIIPGLGGTQRLARRIGWPLAKWMVYTGATVNAQDALALGLTDAVAPFAGLDAACLAAARAGAADPGTRVPPTAPPAPGWAPLWDLFAGRSVDALLASAAADPPSPTAATSAGASADPRVARALQQLSRKSRAALRVAERLMDQGAALPLAEALALELSALEEVFAHPDALEGLSALVEGRRPTFA